MPGTLIIGYGNSLRGDDGIGPLAAERLRERISDPQVEILALHQLTPELMEPISRAGRVFFIDAALGPNPGQIDERPVHPDAAPRSFTHHATPEGLLAGARALYGAAPPAVLITITAAGFEVGTAISLPVQNALEEVCRRIVSRGCESTSPHLHLGRNNPNIGL
jgi:hydrogenase maturation protease